MVENAHADAEVNRILAMSDDEVIASIVAEGRDPQAIAERMRGQMGAAFELCAEITRWKEEARSWRTVAEKLETEKRAAEAENATLRASAERMEADHAEEIARLKAAGRLLAGVEHNGMPEVRA